MPVHSAPHRDRNHPDGRADQLRHHILTLGTQSESESDIEIVSSVELGKRLRRFRENAHDSLQDEVAYGLTMASLLKEAQSVVHADNERKMAASIDKFEAPHIF